MKPRCNGNRPGAFLSGFQCCLDEGHAGPCQPYQPPTVDEWRARNAAEAELERGLREALAYECGRANRMEANNVRLRHRVVDLLAYIQGERSFISVETDAPPDLDAQVIAGVQREREG